MLTELLNNISIYGLGILFLKAGLIILISHSLYEQFEFSPASIKHNIWLLTFISLALLPLLSAILPAIELAILTNQSPVLQQGDNNHSLLSTHSLIALYIAVASIKLLKLAWEVIKVAKISAVASLAPKNWQQLSRKIHAQNSIIKISTDIDSPLTWGSLKPVILLPERAIHWREQELEMVLLHELAHIQRRDWLSQLLGQLICILYWPIPGIQRVLKKMSLEAERSADDEVLRTGKTAPDYAGLLVKQARITHLQASVALGNPSELNLRVNHIISRYIDRSHVNVLRRLLISCCWLCLLPLAAIKTTAKVDQPFLFYQNLSPTQIVPEKSNKIDLMNNYLISPLPRPQKPINVIKPPSLINVKTESNIAINIQKADNPSIKSSIEIREQYFQHTKLVAIKTSRPKYPNYAINNNLEGHVIIQFDINSKGRTLNHQFIESSHQSFKKPVLQAVSQYQYQPLIINNQATDVLNIQEKFSFKLHPPSQVINHPARASPD